MDDPLMKKLGSVKNCPFFSYLIFPSFSFYFLLEFGNCMIHPKPTKKKFLKKLPHYLSRAQ